MSSSNGWVHLLKPIDKRRVGEHLWRAFSIAIFAVHCSAERDRESERERETERERERQRVGRRNNWKERGSEDCNKTALARNNISIK